MNKRIVNDEIDLLEFILILWKYKYKILLITTLFVVVMFGYQTTQPQNKDVSTKGTATTNIIPISSLNEAKFMGYNFYLNKTILAEKSIKLRSTEALVDHLVEVGFDRAMGARPLSRKISELIKVPLSKKILFDNIAGGSSITADYTNNTVEFVVVDPIDDMILLENKTVDDQGFIIIE